MTQHFDAQIMRLKEQILDLGNLVERALDNAIRAVEDRDVELARQVVDGDREIDMAEVALGEECLHTLALYQPVASDMRYIGSVLTINKDLERIADLAVNMAEQAIRLAAEPPLTDIPLDLRRRVCGCAKWSKTAWTLWSIWMRPWPKRWFMPTTKWMKSMRRSAGRSRKSCGINLRMSAV